MDTATSGKCLKVAKHRPDSKDFPPLRQFNVTLLYRNFFWVLLTIMTFIPDIYFSVLILSPIAPSSPHTLLLELSSRVLSWRRTRAFSLVRRWFLFILFSAHNVCSMIFAQDGTNVRG
jgi:hypothetical protein